MPPKSGQIQGCFIPSVLPDYSMCRKGTISRAYRPIGTSTTTNGTHNLSVDTYIPWNLHEPRRGEYDFHGFWNIERFIQNVHDAGLMLILRPGPYICAEWDFGGFPSWLLHDPDIKFRTSNNKKYLSHVKMFLSKLFPVLEPYQYNKGGPVIALQVCHLIVLTDCMNLGTHVVTCSFKAASLNPKTVSCTQLVSAGDLQ